MTTPRLATTSITATSAPRRWALLLHGILGRRANWRAIARGIVESLPDWGVLLVDLRQHGDSQGFAPPHTVAAAAADLLPLAQTVDGPIEAVLGHSFGGKVALAHAESRPPGLRQVVTFDASPAAIVSPQRGGTTTDGVISMLEGLPRRFASREAFVSRVVDDGKSEVLARWLAMNLERQESGDFTFAIDVASIRALLEDYFRVDLWPFVEGPRPGIEVALVVAGLSTVYDAAGLARARAAADDVHVIPRAGHWVHMDAKDALLGYLVERLG